MKRRTSISGQTAAIKKNKAKYIKQWFQATGHQEVSYPMNASADCPGEFLGLDARREGGKLRKSPAVSLGWEVS